MTTDRDKLQRLKDSEAFYRAITETSTSFVVVHDRNNILVYASPSSRLYGYEPDEIVGKMPQDFIHPEDWPLLEGVVERCRMQPGETIHVGDIRAVHKDGHWLWFAGQLTCLYGHPGVDGILFIGHEITDRKKAEETALQLKTAIAKSAEGIAVCDVDGILQYVNSAWAKMHGWDAEALPGKHLSIFHTDDQLEKEVLPFNQVLFNRGSHMGEVDHMQKDGQVFTAWHSGTVARDDQGRVTSMMAVIHDITAEKSAQLALRESEEKYRTLVEQSLQGISILQGDPMQMVYCNPALAQLLGIAKEDLLAMPVEELRAWVHPEDLPAAMTQFQDRLAGHEFSPNMEVIMAYRNETPLITTLDALLPKSFNKQSIKNK